MANIINYAICHFNWIIIKKELTGTYNFDFDFKIEVPVLRKIWRFAAGMLLITFVAGLNTQLDKLAISKFLPIEDLGIIHWEYHCQWGLSYW